MRPTPQLSVQTCEGGGLLLSARCCSRSPLPSSLLSASFMRHDLPRLYPPPRLHLVHLLVGRPRRAPREDRWGDPLPVLHCQPPLHGGQLGWAGPGGGGGGVSGRVGWGVLAARPRWGGSQGAGGGAARDPLLPHAYPAPPLQTPGLACDGLLGGGGGGGDGRQVTVSRGGGGVARVFQGKLWYPPLMRAKRTHVKRLLR